MIDAIAAWRVGELEVTLEVKRWPDSYRLRWRPESSRTGDESIECFGRCSEALVRARELGVQITIRPNLDEVCAQRGPPGINTDTGCPTWNRPNDYSPFHWFVYLDAAGVEGVRDERDWTLIRRELWERCDVTAVGALEDGLVPARGIGGRLKFIRPSDPGLHPWYGYLRIPESYRDQMVSALGRGDHDSSPDEWALGHADDDPILELPI